jgi:hypothetical protein
VVLVVGVTAVAALELVMGLVPVVVVVLVATLLRLALGLEPGLSPSFGSPLPLLPLLAELVLLVVSEGVLIAASMDIEAVLVQLLVASLNPSWLQGCTSATTAATAPG